MSECEQKIIESLTNAVKTLPETKREYLIGFAEGVAAMAQPKTDRGTEETPASV